MEQGIKYILTDSTFFFFESKLTLEGFHSKQNFMTYTIFLPFQKSKRPLTILKKVKKAGSIEGKKNT